MKRKRHVWRNYLGEQRFRSWCGLNCAETGDHPTVYNGLNKATCVRCLDAIHRMKLFVAQQAVSQAQEAFETVMKIRRKRKQ